MAQQVTLKLAVPVALHQALQRQPLLRQATQRQSQQLTSIYYDTGRRALQRAGIALRLRKNGLSWQQTIKRQDPSRAGLTVRPEWDSPYLGHFDFSAIDDGELKAWLNRPKVLRNLAAIFESSLKRTTWRLELPSGGVILAMLDRGWIAASGRRKPISELELRLLSGSLTELYDTGIALARRLALVPSLQSKVDRGYALYLNTPPGPLKACPVPLDSATGPLAAFRLIALNCLEHLQQNHSGALIGEDPEYVHQMRVATRRLRAALRMFKPVLSADFIERLTLSLRELMLPLGRVRDFDVLMAEIVAPVARALPGDPRLTDLAGVVTDRLYSARAEAELMLSRPQYALMLLEAGASLHGSAFIALAESEQIPLEQFARQRLRSLLRKTLRLAAAAKEDQPSSLHELRISVKRLRYGIEFFGDLVEGNRASRLLEHLASLQEELGQLNDLASAGASLMACAGNDPNLREAVALIGGWHGARYARLLAAIPEQLKKLVKLKLQGR